MAAPEPDVAPLEAHLARALRALTQDGSHDRFGVAASGGPDSMALLDLTVRLFPGRVEAATVDHGLRAASASEAAMVADWCRDHEVSHVTLHPEGGVTGNVQGWARRQRYALLEDWRLARGIHWILTAHHADDQLETLLMRLNRGAGVNGLAGVRAKQGRVLRPLLEVRRAELLAYAEQRGLPFIHDPSNTDPRFDRALIREKLGQADWLDARAATRSAAALAEAEEALDWMVDLLEAQHLRFDKGAWTLDRTDLPRELLRRLLLRMIARVEPDAPAQRGDSIDRALAAAMEGRQVSIGHVLLKGGPRWTVKPAPPRR